MPTVFSPAADRNKQAILGGVLNTYGPYLEDGVRTAPANNLLLCWQRVGA